MATLFSLSDQIEQFLQHNDQQTVDRLIHWLEVRLKWNAEQTTTTPVKSLIQTSQTFLCACGHRYSLRFSMTDLLASGDEGTSTENDAEEKALSPIVSTCKRVKTSIAENHSSKLLICTHCQIRLHTRETFLQHYSMHQQGYTFCKRCFQFYKLPNDQNELHDCEQGKSDLAKVSTAKCDELHSLEQLIPPETLEQSESSAVSHLVRETSNGLADYSNDHDAASAARLTRFGLPIFTDSIVEMTLPDGKRQFRCPLCLNSYVNRSGLNRHYITHSSQDLWKVECQFCGKRYSRKDSLKHHMKTQHAQLLLSDPIWNEKHHSFYHPSNDTLSIHPLEIDEDDLESSSSSTDKQRMDSDEIVLIA